MASTAIASLSSQRRMTRNRRKHERRRGMREIERRMEKVRREMKEIGEEQRKIGEGQREVRVKAQVLASECRRLRLETDAILEQSTVTQQRLALMFAILRARDANDTTTADELVMRLRELITSHKVAP